jgi:hypothetical protein
MPINLTSSGETKLGGTFTLPGASMTVNRMGYGAMQLAGPGVFGPPKIATQHWQCFVKRSRLE